MTTDPPHIKALLELNRHAAGCHQCQGATFACDYCLEGYKLWEKWMNLEDKHVGNT